MAGSKIVSIICLAGIAFLVLFLLYAKERGTFEKEAVPEGFRKLWIFWRAGDLLAEKAEFIKRRSGVSNRSRYERICSEIYPREPGADSFRRVDAGRYGLTLLILAVALTLGLLSGISGTGDEILTFLKRNAAGGGAVTYSFFVKGLEDEDVQLQIKVDEQLADDVDALFETAYEEAYGKLFSDGDDADEARHSLTFSKSLCSGMVKASWECADSSLIDHDGTLKNEDISDEGTVTELYLTLEYEDEERIYVFEIRVCPPEYTEEELRIAGLTETIKDIESEGRDSATVELPKEIDGAELTYYSSSDKVSAIQVVLIGICFAALWFVFSLRKLENQAEKRSAQMLKDYPEVVLKLTILLKAGSTVRGAWERVIKGYASQVEAKAEERYVYEEMRQTNIMISGGRPEGEAYLEFGKRTRLHCYLKLSSLLEQNLKKGGKNLTRLLESESDKTWHDRRASALKKGEEASTKMVVPMMLNMIVVMMVIMIPAMLSLF